MHSGSGQKRCMMTALPAATNNDAAFLVVDKTLRRARQFVRCSSFLISVARVTECGEEPRSFWFCDRLHIA